MAMFSSRHHERETRELRFANPDVAPNPEVPETKELTSDRLKKLVDKRADNSINNAKKVQKALHDDLDKQDKTMRGRMEKALKEERIDDKKAKVIVACIKDGKGELDKGLSQLVEDQGHKRELDKYLGASSKEWRTLPEVGKQYGGRPFIYRRYLDSNGEPTLLAWYPGYAKGKYVSTLNLQTGKWTQMNASAFNLNKQELEQKYEANSSAKKANSSNEDLKTMANNTALEDALFGKGGKPPPVITPELIVKYNKEKPDVLGTGKNKEIRDRLLVEVRTEAEQARLEALAEAQRAAQGAAQRAAAAQKETPASPPLQPLSVESVARPKAPTQRSISKPAKEEGKKPAAQPVPPAEEQSVPQKKLSFENAKRVLDPDADASASPSAIQVFKNVMKEQQPASSNSTLRAAPAANPAEAQADRVGETQNVAMRNLLRKNGFTLTPASMDIGTLNLQQVAAMDKALAAFKGDAKQMGLLRAGYTVQVTLALQKNEQPVLLGTINLRVTRTWDQQLVGMLDAKAEELEKKK